MDKEYANLILKHRIKVLKQRYKLLCHGLDDGGAAMKPKSAAVSRTLVRRELRTLQLIRELVNLIPDGRMYLSDDAESILEMLVEPNERHRRIKYQEPVINE